MAGIISIAIWLSFRSAPARAWCCVRSHSVKQDLLHSTDPIPQQSQAPAAALFWMELGCGGGSPGENGRKGKPVIGPAGHDRRIRCIDVERVNEVEVGAVRNAGKEGRSSLRIEPDLVPTDLRHFARGFRQLPYVPRDDPETGMPAPLLAGLRQDLHTHT